MAYRHRIMALHQAMPVGDRRLRHTAFGPAGEGLFADDFNAAGAERRAVTDRLIEGHLAEIGLILKTVQTDAAFYFLSHKSTR